MRTIVLVFVVAVMGCACEARRAHAIEPNDSATTAPLADRLKAGLKARRPEETSFLEEVAHLVDTGALPRKLVDSTSMWAIRRRQDYPFPAFERALRLQADRLGVEFRR